jgi:hypothetical protein
MTNKKKGPTMNLTQKVETFLCKKIQQNQTKQKKNVTINLGGFPFLGNCADSQRISTQTCS